MIARALIAAVAGAVLVPAAANAAITRPVQAFDTPTFRTIWPPRTSPRRPATRSSGASRARQPEGRSTHDVWLVAPGGAAAQLGASYRAPKATAVGQPGRHVPVLLQHPRRARARRHERHGRGQPNPGPPVDPGMPWNDPDWVDPDYPNDGPAPLPNPTLAPTVFEEGDNTPPLLELLKVTPTEKAAKVKVEVSEAGTLTLRLKRGRGRRHRAGGDRSRQEHRDHQAAQAPPIARDATACRCGRRTPSTSTP